MVMNLNHWLKKIRKVKWISDLNFKSVIAISICLIIIIIYSNIWANSLSSTLFNESTKINEIVTVTIEILTVVALAIGTLMHIGSVFALRKNYRFIRVGFGNKELTIIYGSMFIFGISIITLYYYYRQLLAIVLIPLIILLFYSGYTTEIKDTHSRQNDKVTLKMFDQDKSDNTRLKIINNLELYQTTDTDYRFKDIIGNEYIIPTGQVQEIIYHH